MLDQYLISPQAKRNVIISNDKHGTFQLPHELTSDLRKLGNSKTSKIRRIIA